MGRKPIEQTHIWKTVVEGRSPKTKVHYRKSDFSSAVRNATAGGNRILYAGIGEVQWRPSDDPTILGMIAQAEAKADARKVAEEKRKADAEQRREELKKQGELARAEVAARERARERNTAREREAEERAAMRALGVTRDISEYVCPNSLDHLIGWPDAQTAVCIDCGETYAA